MSDSLVEIHARLITVDQLVQRQKLVVTELSQKQLATAGPEALLLALKKHRKALVEAALDLVQGRA